ncbi:MAG: hypothetical protein LQ352_004390 [Teloschistes flavicans]|nr:MAG: hypothetical protein LQ352_004390 [Teloschistes flavicans]
MSDSVAQPHAAYIEDYNEDANTTLPETRQTANVATKRSKPDLARVKVTELGRDEASDSGYSSHTGATLNSGNSSLGSKAGSATLTLDTSVESLAANRRKPMLVERRSHKTPRSPLKPILRRSESKRPSKEGVRQESCRCEECLVKAKSKGSRPAVSGQKPSPTDAGHVKQRSGPNLDTIPPPASKAAPDAPILHPAQPRPRHPGQSYRATPRPVSFHGGIVPQPMYYQTLFLARPPSTAPTPPPFPPPSYPPPTTSYFVPPLQHTGPPGQPSPLHAQTPQPLSYNLPPRPPSRQWAPGPHLPPQQQVVYSAPPVVDYPHSAQYSGALPPPHPVLHRTFSERDRERPLPLRDEYFTFDEDYYRMPPPPVPLPPKTPANTSAHQRPSMRHVASSSARVTRPEHFFPERSEKEQIDRSPDKYDYEGYEQPRRPSLASRRSAANSNDKSHGVNALERDLAQMTVESNAASKQRRRMTFYGGPLPRDLERKAEVYQAQKSIPVDPTSIPLTADSLKLVRRKTQTSNSDTGSRGSGEGRASREGSDVKPRSATGRRSSGEMKARNELDGITMRFPASQGVNVDLKGNSEGRTISLRQSRDGQGNMELSIGSKYESRDKSRRRQSYVDGAGVRELEYARTASRMGRSSREVVRDRPKDRSTAPSRSRKSSRTRRALME